MKNYLNSSKTFLWNPATKLKKLSNHNAAKLWAKKEFKVYGKKVILKKKYMLHPKSFNFKTPDALF